MCYKIEKLQKWEKNSNFFGKSGKNVVEKREKNSSFFRKSGRKVVVLREKSSNSSAQTVQI